MREVYNITLVLQSINAKKIKLSHDASINPLSNAVPNLGQLTHNLIHIKRKLPILHFVWISSVGIGKRERQTTTQWVSLSFPELEYKTQLLLPDLPPTFSVYRDRRKTWTLKKITFNVVPHYFWPGPGGNICLVFDGRGGFVNRRFKKGRGRGR